VRTKDEDEMRERDSKNVNGPESLEKNTKGEILFYRLSHAEGKSHKRRAYFHT